MKTKNFKLLEFTYSSDAQILGIDNAPPLEIMENLKYTMEKMQELRDKLNLPIIVTSGYRCPKLNKFVNGAKNSDHLTGLGVDFYVSGYSFDEQKCLSEILKKSKDVRYVKFYQKTGHIHVSWKKNQ